RLELGAVHRPRLERPRRPRRRMEPARGAALPGRLPQLQLPPRASPAPGHSVDPPAPLREAGRPRAVVRVDLLAALARRGPRTPRPRPGAASGLGLPPQRGAAMTARGISWPTRSRVTTGIAGAIRVALVFFPVYIGCAALTAARAEHWHPYAGWELGI